MPHFDIEVNIDTTVIVQIIADDMAAAQAVADKLNPLETNVKFEGDEWSWEEFLPGFDIGEIRQWDPEEEAELLEDEAYEAEMLECKQENPQETEDGPHA
ncbi:MAG TPA: hypothetical protein VMQ76_12080 [Terracidiphilus sp.]|jgi:hypothetical protein|nr:hypothetical protein [Terracidiphilus sp.]